MSAGVLCIMSFRSRVWASLEQDPATMALEDSHYQVSTWIPSTLLPLDLGSRMISGGLSFFGSREGFVCDNVVNYEVVLASGKVVNANAKENSDLFKALKGGGNNFGVVTRFDMRTFKQGPFWGGSAFYFADQFPSQVEALVNEVTKPDASEETHIMISLFFAEEIAKGMGLNQALGLNQAYYSQEVEKPPVLEPFVAMQPQIDQLNSMRMITLKGAAEEQAAMARTGVRYVYLRLSLSYHSKYTIPFR